VHVEHIAATGGERSYLVGPDRDGDCTATKVALAATATATAAPIARQHTTDAAATVRSAWSAIAPAGRTASSSGNRPARPLLSAPEAGRTGKATNPKTPVLCNFVMTTLHVD